MTNTLTPEQIAQGWKLVPNEATQDMLDAYYNAHKECFAPLRPAEIYSVMLAAAPLPSPPVSGGVKLEWRDNEYNRISRFQHDLLINGRRVGMVEKFGNGEWHPYFMDFSKLASAPCDSMEAAKAVVESDARAWLPPLTNEPVGVTLPADLARCLLVENNQHEKHLLQWTEGRATNKLDEYINLLKQSRDRLSAAIGELG